MKRRGYGLIFTLAFAVVFGFFSFAAQANTLPNGLQLVAFEVKTGSPSLAGTMAYVEMTLKNISATPIKFSQEFGIFVACRFGDLGDKGNRDFGHGNSGLVLPP